MDNSEHFDRKDNDSSESSPETNNGPEPETVKPRTREKVLWSVREFEMMRPTYYRLSLNSARLLEIAKQCKAKESTMHYMVVILSLTSSFVAALQGINETVRAYITSAFTLISALLSGWMSKKGYGQRAGKYYSAYQEYKDLLTILDNVMVSLKSDRDYESFNYLISKVEGKYEIILPIDIIDVERIERNCTEKFHVVERRVADAEREAIRTVHKKFIDRKSYVYQHESKLNMYRQYIFHETVKNNRTASNLLTCTEYEDWCRTNHSEKYREITRVYDRYVQQQIGRFYLLNGEFNTSKIELELATHPIFALSDAEFYLTVNDKFLLLQQRIRDRTYELTDEAPRADENYSLDG